MADCKKCEWHCCGNCGNTELGSMKEGNGTIICKALPIYPSPERKGKTPIAPRSPCKLWIPRKSTSKEN